MREECNKCRIWNFAAQENGYAKGVCGECFDKLYAPVPKPTNFFGMKAVVENGILTMDNGLKFDLTKPVEEE